MGQIIKGFELRQNHVDLQPLYVLAQRRQSSRERWSKGTAPEDFLGDTPEQGQGSDACVRGMRFNNVPSATVEKTQVQETF